MEEDQQFCLRWNNHQSTLISVFDTLLENGTLVDCTLAAEGKFLKAHKVVLSACSPYFATLLSQQYDKHPIFILKDVKFQELRAMMDYMYRGEVNISQDQLGALLKAAESLQIKGLSDNRSNTTQKNDTKQQVPVSKSGLTIEQKRPLKHPAIDIDSDMAVSREGSTSPTSRKRKKFRRRSTEGNSITDNHDHSNSSSQSLPHVASASGSVNNLNTSVVNVTKKTEILQQQIDIKTGLEHVLDEHEENHDDEEEDEEIASSHKQEIDILSEKEKQQMDTHSELMIEPKNEYDDNETVEDLTLEDEELLEDLDQAGPSHGGEGSSQGYAQWQVERSQDEVFMASQESTGQHRDAQVLTTKMKPATTRSVTGVNTTSIHHTMPKEHEKRFMKSSLKKLKTSINQNTSSSSSSVVSNIQLNDNYKKTINNTLFKNSNQCHPRIKYSKHKNPNQLTQIFSSKTSTSSSSSIDLHQQVKDINIIKREEQKTTEQQQLQQTKIKHFSDIETITSGNSSNVDNDDLHSSIMTDLANYAEIDDIELADGSQIGFGEIDEFRHQEDDTKNHSSASLDDDYSMANDSMKFEYLSDSAVSATDELGRHYICRHCGKRYRWKSTLRRHENVECGGKEPMHQCPHCPYKAKQRGNLGVHIRKHHTQMPPLESRRKLNRTN